MRTKSLARFVLSSMILLALLGPLAAAAADSVFRPLPIWIPQGLAQDQVKALIAKALVNRGWEAKPVAAGQIEGRLARVSYDPSSSDISVVVLITYDDKDVNISYKDSQGLDYDQGDATISNQYNRWVRNLEKDIRIFMSREAL